MLQHHRLQATMNSFVIHGFSIYLFLQVTLTSAYTDFMVFSHLCVLMYVLFKLKDLDLSEMVLLFFLVCSSWHILIFHWDFFERNSHLWHSFSVLKGAMHILKMLFESFINPLSKFDLVHCTDATTLYRSSGVFNPTWHLNQTGSQVSSLFLNVENVQEMVFVLLPQICQAPVYLCGSK